MLENHTYCTTCDIVPTAQKVCKDHIPSNQNNPRLLQYPSPIQGLREEQV